MTDPEAPKPDDLKSLWQCQPTELTTMSLDDLHTRAIQFQSQVSNRNRREYFGSALVVLIFGGMAAMLPDPFMRLGSVLTVLAAALICIIIFLRGQSAGKDALDEDCLNFHRQALIRQRDLLRTVWLWYLMPFVPGLAIFLWPILRDAPDARRLIVYGYCGLVAAYFIFVAVINIRGAKCLQKEIDRLQDQAG